MGRQTLLPELPPLPTCWLYSRVTWTRWREWLSRQLLLRVTVPPWPQGRALWEGGPGPPTSEGRVPPRKAGSHHGRGGGWLCERRGHTEELCRGLWKPPGRSREGNADGLTLEQRHTDARGCSGLGKGLWAAPGALTSDKPGPRREVLGISIEPSAALFLGRPSYFHSALGTVKDPNCPPRGQDQQGMSSGKGQEWSPGAWAVPCHCPTAHGVPV